MFVLLLPLIGAILLCRYTQRPVNLLQDTEFCYLDSMHTYRTVVRDYPSPRRRTQRIEVELLSMEDSLSVPLHQKTILYIATDSLGRAAALQVGDTLLLRTRIQRGGTIDGFDYGNYLRMQGLVGTGYVPAHAWRCIARGNASWHPKTWQQHLSQRLSVMPFTPRERGTLQALTLGYKEDIDSDVRRCFQASGAAHVLAVSGLHTGIIYTVFWLLFTGFGRWKPLYEDTAGRIALSVALLLVLWGYALLTGLTPSVVRSSLMLSIVQVGYMCRRQAVSLNTLAAAALLILIANPRDLFSVSFQLSVAAVAAILILQPSMKSCLPYRLTRRVWINKVWTYLRDLILVSIAAWLGTMPLTTYYFGQTSNYFLLTNLMVLPLATLAVAGGLLCLLLGTLPWIGQVVCWLTQAVVWLMNTAVGWVESLPGSVTVIRISPLMVMLLYGAIVAGALTMTRKLWWAIPCAACLTAFGYLYTLI